MGEWIQNNIDDQIEWMNAKAPKGATPAPSNNVLMINLYTTGTSKGPKISKATDESYRYIQGASLIQGQIYFVQGDSLIKGKLRLYRVLLK